jgi:hypothetical protein
MRKPARRRLKKQLRHAKAAQRARGSESDLDTLTRVRRAAMRAAGIPLDEGLFD